MNFKLKIINKPFIKKMIILNRYIQIKYNYMYYTKYVFKKNLGYNLDLKNPQTFNEKIQWLKIYYRDPKMSDYADKYKVRNIIKNLIGEEYLIELYGVYESVNEINFDILPNQFVLKPNHSSGRIIICNNKNNLDKKSTIKTLSKWLKENYYFAGGEWVYKNIEPKILCERLLDENISDYKVYCYNGKALYTQVICNRKGSNYNISYYDLDWNPIEVKRIDHIYNENIFDKPINFNKMIELSNLISKDFPFVRVDFYNIEGRLYFGETTFFPANGLIKFLNKEEDLKWGKYLNLPQKL